MEQKKEKRTNYIILLVIIILLLVGVMAVLTSRLFSTKEEEKSTGRLVYEANVVVEDAESLQDAVDKMYEKAKEGQMALEMQTEATSRDGKKFKCYLANSKRNNYDMFMVFYLDETQEEIYRTGLIPIGARIENFDLEEPLKSGNHEITIVFNQVEDDQETIHAQVNVGLTLIVQ